MDNVDSLDNLDDNTPEQIAQQIFCAEPVDPCTITILGDQMHDLTYIFEILITIFMEGFEILTGGLNQTDMSNFSVDHIVGLDPWFNSLGFKIYSQVFNEKEDKDLYKDYYCKIMIKTKLNETFFIMKNVQKNYHFLLNGPYLEKNRATKELKDLKGVFIHDNKAFTVYFDLYKF